MKKKQLIGKCMIIILAALLNIAVFMVLPGMDAPRLMRNSVYCLLIDLIAIIVFFKQEAVLEIPKEIWKDRKLIFNLSKNDFKTKFAGSYLGIIWAFVQPVITVIVYWFVFEKALNAGAQATKSGITVPYVLWLIAGLVPWFFFSDALSTGTSAFIEYSYLVKKVVFKISVLPVVKVISNLYVHIFFIAFTFVMYGVYRQNPGIYAVQIIYYSGCMFVLVLGLIYFTSALVVFFRDLSQIINIILQVGIWATPIMWNIETVEFSEGMLRILKLNPMYYVVDGYRDALINGGWFWQNPEMTIYFWIVTILIFIFGTMMHRKLQVHFADVL